ncbi:hypothetical protein HYU20_03600 [Candidatus Woesearchaeota archaeon]|nr:hypothetical protein [Candidatus Woesearchaeota archaeon]
MVKILFETRHRIALGAALLLLLGNIYLFKGKIFFVPFLAVVAIAATLPYWLDIMRENKRQKEIEARFPEFVRNLERSRLTLRSLPTRLSGPFRFTGRLSILRRRPRTRS